MLDIFRCCETMKSYRTNEMCLTYEWVMSHKWMSHVSHVNESCLTYEWVMSHIWTYDSTLSYMLPDSNLKNRHLFQPHAIKDTGMQQGKGKSTLWTLLYKTAHSWKDRHSSFVSDFVRNIPLYGNIASFAHTRALFLSGHHPPPPSPSIQDGETCIAGYAFSGRAPFWLFDLKRREEEKPTKRQVNLNKI